MTAAATAARPSSGALAAQVRQQLRRIGPLGTIVLLHVAFFYALQSGLLRQAAEALPREVTVTFVTPQPQPKPEAPKPEPAPEKPKTVPVVKKRAAPPPPVPVVNTAPSQNAITAPPAPPAPPAPAAEPAPPVVSAPPAPPAPALPRTITTGIEYLKPPQPEYPPASRRMGEEGKAVLRVLVNDKGRPERVEVQQSSGSARLDEAARQAVLRALFKPFMEDGRPVPAYAVVPIRFQLDN